MAQKRDLLAFFGKFGGFWGYICYQNRQKGLVFEERKEQSKRMAS